MTDTQTPVAFELTPGASTLYVFFGGMAAGIAMPPFEFYKSSNILDANRIFVRDFSQCWYHAGLPGLSRDIRSTAAYLRREVDKLAPRRLVLVGNSMGGFAAILFSALLGQGEVVAFAPQTFISPWLRRRHGDDRWPDQVRRVWRQGLFRPRCWDLRRLLAKRRAVGKISVFVSPMDKLDHIHARRIQGLPEVYVHELDAGGHDVVRSLRDSGSLPAIMAGGYV